MGGSEQVREHCCLAVLHHSGGRRASGGRNTGGSEQVREHCCLAVLHRSGGRRSHSSRMGGGSDQVRGVLGEHCCSTLLYYSGRCTTVHFSTTVPYCATVHTASPSHECLTWSTHRSTRWSTLRAASTSLNTSLHRKPSRNPLRPLQQNMPRIAVQCSEVKNSSQCSTVQCCTVNCS